MEWKPVPGFAFVEASDSGLVRTVEHDTLTVQKHRTYSQTRKGCVLVQAVASSGHRTVNLPDPSGRWRQRRQGVHRLVCLAFHGEPPEGKPFALHNDDDPANNVPGNLYWGDHADNTKDKTLNGHTPKGAAHGMTSLTDVQVAEIRAAYKPRSKEFGAFALAALYGVHRTTIENIVKRRTWG
jgi:hypothetical protein